MTGKRISRRFYSILLTLAAVVLLNVGNAEPGHAFSLFGTASPEQQAYEKSRDEFKAIHESASATKDAVDKAKKAIDAVAVDLDDQINRLKRAGDAVPRELRDGAAKIKNAQKTLERSQELLSNFGDYSEKITAATDVYDEIVELRKKMAADSQTLGPLGGELRAMGTLMQKADKIPILGDAIKAYGEVTVGLVDKLGEVATVIDNRNQDALGAGATDTNERARIFHEFERSHPELKGNVNYFPAKTPAYLYVPEHEATGMGVLWDEETKKFTVVPKDIPVKRIFQMKLLNGERLSASELVMHMEEWNKGGAKRDATSRDLYTFFNQLKTFDREVMSRVSEDSHEELFALLRNPKLFEARYVYDRKAHDRLHRDLKDIYDHLLAKGDEDSKKQAALIRKFAEKRKLGIAFSTPEPPKPEKKTVQKDGPSTFEGFFKGLADGLEKLNKDLEKLNTTTAAPQKTTTSAPPPATPVQKAEQTPAPPPKPAVKAGGVVGSCSECRDNGLDCACGKAACRCCAPGDSGCNAFDL